MKKLAAVFAIAVLGPSLVLGWLATRSLRDQEVIVHSQRALLHQGATDALAAELNRFLDDVRVFYGSLLEEMIAERGAEPLAADFDAAIRSRWSQAAVGAAVTVEGRWLHPPSAEADPRMRRFLSDTQSFLQNEAATDFYLAPSITGNVVTVEREGSKRPTDERAATSSTPEAGAMPATASAAASSFGKAPVDPSPKSAETRQSTAQQKVTVAPPAAPASPPLAAAAPAPAAAPAAPVDAAAEAPRSRNVKPLSQLDRLQSDGRIAQLAEAASNVLEPFANGSPWSALDLNSGQLSDLIATGPEGAISRFVSGGLQILLWRRDPAAPDLVFWVQLDLEALKQELSEVIRQSGTSLARPEACLALLDAGGQVVARTHEDFNADWERPFVASEVGALLPHWEVAAYLIDPRAVARTAQTARLMLWMLVPVLLGAIGLGSALIIREIGREMALARQKTDFVSNVSHELKTPLTSIRLFSDLLSQRSGLDETKRTEYSGIISREAARLSRLINNLLDFSRMERGERRYRMEPIDARAVVRDTVEMCRHQIESDGYTLTLRDDGDARPAPVAGDRDALAQVLLNLLSNAEKYGGSDRHIEVETRLTGPFIEIDVLDRGPGVPRRLAAKIFEKFYRADDSLSSGIEGSGLGLTLARQIARAHRGEVEYHPRPGGGSRFTLRLPLDTTATA